MWKAKQTPFVEKYTEKYENVFVWRTCWLWGVLWSVSEGMLSKTHKRDARHINTFTASWYIPNWLIHSSIFGDSQQQKIQFEENMRPWCIWSKKASNVVLLQLAMALGPTSNTGWPHKTPPGSWSQIFTCAQCSISCILLYFFVLKLGRWPSKNYKYQWYRDYGHST